MPHQVVIPGLGRKATAVVTKKVGIFFQGTIAEASVPEVLSNIVKIPPKSIARLLHLQIWHGLSDDPNDGEAVEFFVEAVDRNAIPDVARLRQTSAWQSVQVWQRVGTPASIVQLMQREEMILIAASRNNQVLAQRTRDYVWGFIAFSSQQSAVRAQGTAVVEITYIDRIYGDDNDTHQDMDEDGITAGVY